TGTLNAGSGANHVILSGAFVGTASTTTVTGDLELDGTLNLNLGAQLNLSASAGVNQQITTASTGYIADFNGGGAVRMANASHTVTINNNITLDGALTIGNSLTGTWINHGIMLGDFSQYPIAFDGTAGNIYTNASDG